MFWTGCSRKKGLTPTTKTWMTCRQNLSISERGQLRLRQWRLILRKNRPLLMQVGDWSASSEICHLLRHVLPAYWKKSVEDKEKKRAKKRKAVHIILPEEEQLGIMEYFSRNLEAPEQMISVKNSVCVEVFGETAGRRLLRLNNLKWGRGARLKLQMIPARMSLDSILQYASVKLKLNSKKKRHIKDCHNHGTHDRREDRTHQDIQEHQGTSSEDGEGSSGADTGTREDREEAHFFAFVADNKKEHGQDKSKWRRAPRRGGMGKSPHRIGDPLLSSKEYREEHDGC